MRTIKILSALLLLVVLVPGVALGQSSSTATVTGTVTDQRGAAVPAASIELINTGTNESRTQTTSDTGSYTFASVSPGNYKVVIKKSGFRATTISPVGVQVGRSFTVDARLEIGTLSETIEVVAGAQLELQTQDASVGNVLDRQALDHIPTLARDATSLLLLQPLASPGFNSVGSPTQGGEGDQTGGQIAGARSDQNTFLLDGGDATDSTAGSGQYSGTNFTATPRAVVPTPVESLEEFRVVTNNPTAGFSRSSGGEVQMVTRRGGNTFHGAAYEYLQNDNLNANTWTRNSLGQKDPELRDNRYGGRIGGPIWKDKTFFFAHYEGRRFVSSTDVVRRVPSASMRAGILHFGPSDTCGVVGGVPITSGCAAYNLNPNPTVDPLTGQSVASSNLDPRNLGLNPAITAVWNLLPAGNQFVGSGADGINTLAFSAPVGTPLSEEFGVIRVDHNITSKWQFTASYRYGKTDFASPVQVDIGGLLPGDTSGQPVSTAARPLAPRYLVTGLTGQITSHLTSEFHFNYLRHWWEWATFAPSLMPSPAGFALPDGTNAALSIGGEGITVGMQPINVDTQNARSRLWNGKDYVFSENLSWLKGNHLLQFGGRAESQKFFHQRDDKVVGGLTSLVYTVGRLSAGSGISGIPIPTDFQGSVSNYRNDYAAVLGMVDRAQQLFTRAPDFSPNPVLTPLLQHTVVDSYSLYVTDSWKIKPSITINLGLTWGTQLPPYEETGEQTMMVNHDTGKIITGDAYIAERKASALAGQIFNPQLDFVPIKRLGRKYPYDPDYSNWSPRVSVAWNPSYSSGLLGSLFGGRKTVVRGGYAKVYDRLNGVGIVMIPALGVGFGNNLRCKAPSLQGGTVTCLGNALSDPTTALRIGTDATVIPMPALNSIPSGDPLIPGDNSPFETLDFRIDPKRKVGYAHTFDLTVQRQLPGNMMLEVGYVGNYAKRLYNGYALSAVPYMYTLGGQSFAEAFSNIANAMRNNGTSAGAIAAIPDQAFLETLMGGAAACGGSCTQQAIAAFADGTDGFLFANVTDFWEGLTIPLSGGADNTQVFDSYMIGSNGRSNYNAGFLSLRKSSGAGLTFNFNYTFSHAFDQIGNNQENLNESSDAFNLDRDYGSAVFDRRHTFTTLVTYDLPFGSGKHYSSGSGALNKVIGGWNIAGVWVYGSGLPIDVYNSTSNEEIGQGGVFGNNAGYISIGNKHYNASPSNGSTNAFPDSEAVRLNFRPPDLFLDGRNGRGFIRSYGRWNMDLGFSKTTKITERVSTRFDCQMTNVFNHPQLLGTGGFYSGDMALDFNTSSSFGAINNQYNSPRFIQFGLRFDF
jgi:hypothetical protein